MLREDCRDTEASLDIQYHQVLFFATLMRNLEAAGEVFRGGDVASRPGMICALIQLAGLLRAHYKSGIGRLGQLIERTSPSRVYFERSGRFIGDVVKNKGMLLDTNSIGEGSGVIIKDEEEGRMRFVCGHVTMAHTLRASFVAPVESRGNCLIVRRLLVRLGNMLCAWGLRRALNRIQDPTYASSESYENSEMIWVWILTMKKKMAAALRDVLISYTS